MQDNIQTNRKVYGIRARTNFTAGIIGGPIHWVKGETVYYGGRDKWHKQKELARLYWRKGWVERLVNDPNFVTMTDGNVLFYDLKIFSTDVK